MDFDELLDQYRTQVHNKGNKIDPNNTLDWFSLTVGWALARGLSPTEASSFAFYYERNINC